MALSGNEVLYVNGVSQNGQLAATLEQTTTGAIAALASDESSFVITAVSNTTGTTLLAAGLVGNQIVRSGPTANFSDATDTAANIIAAYPGGLAAGSNSIQIKNTTAFTQTLTAGTGVTLPVTVIIPPLSVGEYFIVPTSGTAVTFYHSCTLPIAIGQNETAPTIVSLATVGAGTITAANFAGGLTSRSGPTAAFTDTTDTAAAIVAACANLVGKIGSSFIYYYENTTAYVGTLTGGTGVTVSGVTAVPANTIAAYLVTYTAATPTVTMVGLGITQAISTALNIAGASSGASTLQAPATGGVTNTLPSTTGTLQVTAPAVTAANATISLTAANSSQTILLNTAAGSVATLPAASGSGSYFKFIVTTTTTSGAHKILAASTADFLNGVAVGHVSAGTTLTFSAAAATAHSIQMPFAGTQPSGGFIGDWFEFTDVAPNLWHVRGMYQSGTTSTTPFSSANS